MFLNFIRFSLLLLLFIDNTNLRRNQNWRDWNVQRANVCDIFEAGFLSATKLTNVLRSLKWLADCSLAFSAVVHAYHSFNR